jgi:crossover junction endodeoxyribonuclease RusA
MKPTTIIMPWPPSVNGYWRSIIRGHGKAARPTQILSEKGREYRVKAAMALVEQRVVAKFAGPVSVTERFYPPDRRRRDMDNHIKAYRDALSHYGLWGDDSQVVEQHGYMCERDKDNPRIEIVIKQLDEGKVA